MRPLRIFTWQVHGSYLYYLAHVPHEVVVPYKQDRTGSYVGLGDSFGWPSNLREIPAEEISRQQFDVILYQNRQNWEVDRHEVLSAAQRSLPAVYLQHDSPTGHATDSKHWVDDSGVMLVHVTDFNSLMWESGRCPTCVIDHGVLPPGNVRYTGEKPAGVVVVNHLLERGRTVGADVFLKAREQVPLDLIGMESTKLGGRGEFHHRQLFAEVAAYRFFFNPIRWTSLPLAVLEALSIGCPVICLATTELVTVIENGVNGFIATRLDDLVAAMQLLLRDPTEARGLGRQAHQTYLERFTLDRFVADWDRLFQAVAGRRRRQFAVGDLRAAPPATPGQQFTS